MEFANHVPYEVTSQPWFGPRARAREHLQGRTLILSPTATRDAILERLGPAGRHVDFLRFIDYVNANDGFHYTIVVVFTRSDPVVRDSVFDSAEDVVSKTGWYPLAAGSRLMSVSREADLLSHVKAASTTGVIDGALISAVDAAGDSGGCSIRLKFESGSILLDAGFPGLIFDNSDRAILLTHGHGDHSGSAWSTDSEIPVYLSSGNAALALARGAERDQIQRRGRVIDPGSHLALGPNTMVSAFAVPHAPGAIGFRIRSHDTSLIYTGDICLRSDRHNFIPELLSEVAADEASRRYVLLDATMAGRAGGASRAAASHAVIAASVGRPDVVLTANSAEHLLYAYVDLFHYVNTNDRGSTEFFLDPNLRDIFRLLHSPFITRDKRRLDPFLVGQYGAAMSAWAESRWAYWLDETQGSWESERRRIWFVGASLAERVKPRGASATAHIGRGDPPLFSLQDVERLSSDVTPWTQHSDAETLVDAIRQLSAHATVVLFHNFPSRLRKFVVRNSLEARVISGTPIQLN